MSLILLLVYLSFTISYGKYPRRQSSSLLELLTRHDNDTSETMRLFPLASHRKVEVVHFEETLGMRTRVFCFVDSVAATNFCRFYQETGMLAEHMASSVRVILPVLPIARFSIAWSKGSIVLGAARVKGKGITSIVSSMLNPANFANLKRTCRSSKRNMQHLGTSVDRELKSFARGKVSVCQFRMQESASIVDCL